MFGIAILSFGLQTYGVYSSAEQMKGAAKLKKEDINLQRESLKLSEEARLLKEEMAEAKVRKDLRRAQAIRLAKFATSGTDVSSVNTAIREGMTTDAESGLSVQEELSGIGTSQAAIQESRLDIASASVQKPTDLDVILGYTGAALSAGMLAYQSPEFKEYREEQKYLSEFDYSYTPHRTDSIR